MLQPYLQVSNGNYIDPFSGQTVPQGKAINRTMYDPADPIPCPPGISWVPDDGAPLWAPSYPRSPPRQVSNAAMRMALFACSGTETGKTLLDAANAACATAGGDAAIYWEYGTTVDRDTPLIAWMGTALGLTPAQVDALFIAAAAITG